MTIRIPNEIIENAEKIYRSTEKDTCYDVVIPLYILDELISGSRCWNEALDNGYDPFKQQK